MKNIDKRIELLKKQQAELERRKAAEKTASEMIKACEFEKAQEILASIDDSIIEEINKELEGLENNISEEKADDIRFAEEKEILRKQLRLLAEKSEMGTSGEVIAVLSEEMARIQITLMITQLISMRYGPRT